MEAVDEQRWLVADEGEQQWMEINGDDWRWLAVVEGGQWWTKLTSGRQRWAEVKGDSQWWTEVNNCGQTMVVGEQLEVVDGGRS